MAIPDTGLGRHPWFDARDDRPARVLRDVDYRGIPIGGEDNDSRLEDNLDGNGRLLPCAGHGTFIAGLIRQGCPEATILPIPVVDPDGFVEEVDLYQALVLLLLRHVEGLVTGDRSKLVDVVTFSLGYYHETPNSPAATAFLRELLAEFGRAGVLVVVAAGNDGTSVPMFPAALAGQVVGFDPDVVPLVSVGALNPGEPRSTAFFSNTGDWVSCERPGAALVSTMPVTFDGSSNRTSAIQRDGRLRATMDPDNFSGGFAVWSGTSFAAPVLAAELAAQLVAQGHLTDTTEGAMVARGWTALERTLEDWSRPAVADRPGRGGRS